MIANLLVESVRHGLMRLVLIALPLAIAGMVFISRWSPELATEDQARDATTSGSISDATSVQSR
jgi:hypothetical protein